MKKTQIIVTAMLLISLTAEGQNLFFFGEKSYPCTETFTLYSNSSSDNLNVLFAKDGTSALIVIRINIDKELMISGNLIIYQDDGTVITCNDRGKYEYVDNIASAVYYLTNEQLSKMKTSNINTVRYSMKSTMGFPLRGEGIYTASNKENLTRSKGGLGKTDFPGIITEFFDLSRSS